MECLYLISYETYEELKQYKEKYLNIKRTQKGFGCPEEIPCNCKKPSETFIPSTFDRLFNKVKIPNSEQEKNESESEVKIELLPKENFITLLEEEFKNKKHKKNLSHLTNSLYDSKVFFIDKDKREITFKGQKFTLFQFMKILKSIFYSKKSNFEHRHLIETFLNEHGIKKNIQKKKNNKRKKFAKNH